MISKLRRLLKTKFLTVVTINYNNDKGLFRTLESVKAQSKRDYFEYLVIDGESNDKSIDIIYY